MKTYIGIDPGNEQSAFIVWNGKEILDKGIVPNKTLLDLLKQIYCPVVIEMVASLGMPVGKTVFDTAFWVGRFYQAVQDEHVELIYRKDIKMYLCGSMRAKDGNIRQRLIDLYEPDLKPRQRPKGILKGLTADEWQALAVVVTYQGLKNPLKGG